MQKGSKGNSEVLNEKDTKHVQGLAISVIRQTNDFHTVIDQIKHDRTLRISDDRCDRAKDHISAASKIMLAYDKGFSTIKLDTAQQRRILEMIQEVADGQREAVMFQANKEGTKIKELFSREIL